MLLDVFLQHCFEVFQHNDLSAVEGLETALQQQTQSQVGARTHSLLHPHVLPLSSPFVIHMQCSLCSFLFITMSVSVLLSCSLLCLFLFDFHVHAPC